MHDGTRIRNLIADQLASDQATDDTRQALAPCLDRVERSLNVLARKRRKGAFIALVTPKQDAIFALPEEFFSVELKPVPEGMDARGWWPIIAEWTGDGDWDRALEAVAYKLGDQRRTMAHVSERMLDAGLTPVLIVLAVRLENWNGNEVAGCGLTVFTSLQDQVLVEVRGDEWAKLVLPGRECGECSLCCKLIEVRSEELNKPAGQWCQHCTKPGCGIYADKPEICSSWQCGWKTIPSMGPQWYPAKSHMVINTAFDDDPAKSKLAVHVDPEFADEWRKPEYQTWLRETARLGLESETPFVTYVIVGAKRWVILPDSEIEWDGEPLLPVQAGKDTRGRIKWKALKFADEEKARKFIRFKQVFHSKVAEVRAATGLKDVSMFRNQILEEAVIEAEGLEVSCD